MMANVRRRAISRSSTEGRLGAAEAGTVVSPESAARSAYWNGWSFKWLTLALEKGECGVALPA
jgi:hypothetical protein